MESIHIPPDSQRRLIDLSRETLESLVRGAKGPHHEIDDPYLRTSDYGAFVSLHKVEELRGCIGTCFPRGPLYETVIEMTEAAASRDHRVPPIRLSELPQIRICLLYTSPSPRD